MTNRTLEALQRLRARMPYLILRVPSVPAVPAVPGKEETNENRYLGARELWDTSRAALVPGVPEPGTGLGTVGTSGKDAVSQSGESRNPAKPLRLSSSGTRGTRGTRESRESRRAFVEAALALEWPGAEITFGPYPLIRRLLAPKLRARLTNTDNAQDTT
jgi:hypothetical protein